MKKILHIIVLVISVSTVFSQTIVLKKDNGTVEYRQLSTNVELIFDTRDQCEITSTVLYGGQTYNTVQIGNQCWLKENLNIGNRIHGASDQTNNNVLEKYCYDNDEAKCTTYGGLYQWAEAVQYQNDATNTTSPSPALSGNIQGICPTGWHIPTNAEFTALIIAVDNDGNAVKAVGQGEIDPIIGRDGRGTNTSGFSALLAGLHYPNGVSGGLGEYANILSSTEYSASDVNYLYLVTSALYIYRFNFSKMRGFSVRCLKD